jgi:hypothetical protein
MSQVTPERYTLDRVDLTKEKPDRVTITTRNYVTGHTREIHTRQGKIDGRYT